MENSLLSFYKHAQRKTAKTIFLSGLFFLLVTVALQYREKSLILTQQALSIEKSIRNDFLSGNKAYVYETCRSHFSDSNVKTLKITKDLDIYCDFNKEETSLFFVSTTVPILFNPSEPISNDNVVGFVSIQLDTEIIFVNLLINILFLIVIILVFYFADRRLHTIVKQEIVLPIGHFSNIMAANLRDVAPLKLFESRTRFAEMHILSKAYLDLMNTLEVTEKNLIEESKRSILVDLSKQVAHDIRSPLSALTMVIGTLKDLPEEKKTLVLHATQRINDIANNLLQKKSLHPGDEGPASTDQIFNPAANALNLSPVYIPQILELLISEKRLQFQNYSDTLITSGFSESFVSFAKIDGVEFARTLSNLINNAAESLVNQNGKVLVVVSYKMRGNSKLINITIQDNGRGIPKEILKRLGEKGVTYGKENTQSGSGLGVYHAKKTIESFGGEFSIDSTEGKGTTVSILLPLAEAPDWFAQQINLVGKKYLVTLDDDSSIHQIWIERLSTLAGLDIEHIKFQSGESFEKYVNSNINKIKECIFLVDYELSNQAKTGLQIIEDLVIEKHSILVTSRYEDQDVVEKAKKLNLKILPKNLCGFVPFNLV